MIVAKTREELSEAISGIPHRNINLVPTMGALHEGHLSLVRAARGRAKSLPDMYGQGPQDNFVVVTIFVNPTQFNDPRDLSRYPRTPEKDLEMLQREGVDVVFMPPVEEVYPETDTRQFDFGQIDKVMEGTTRPGHFNGVAQVVSRLFELTEPAAAYFGQKDFQQVAVVREMTRQLGLGVEIVECPTVREEDGLAMSSRNRLLSPEHRRAAPDIYRALKLGLERAGAVPPRELERFVTAEAERSGILKVIYFNIVDADTLAPIGDWTVPRRHGCIAVEAGGVRLIDNLRY